MQQRIVQYCNVCNRAVENTTKIGHDLYEYIDEKETKVDYIHTYLKVRSRQLKHCQNNIQFSLEHFGISYN